MWSSCVSSKGQTELEERVAFCNAHLGTEELLESLEGAFQLVTNVKMPEGIPENSTFFLGKGVRTLRSSTGCQDSGSEGITLQNDFAIRKWLANRGWPWVQNKMHGRSKQHGVVHCSSYPNFVTERLVFLLGTSGHEAVLWAPPGRAVVSEAWQHVIRMYIAENLYDILDAVLFVWVSIPVMQMHFEEVEGRLYFPMVAFTLSMIVAILGLLRDVSAELCRMWVYGAHYIEFLRPYDLILLFLQLGKAYSIVGFIVFQAVGGDIDLKRGDPILSERWSFMTIHETAGFGVCYRCLWVLSQMRCVREVGTRFLPIVNSLFYSVDFVMIWFFILLAIWLFYLCIADANGDPYFTIFATFQFVFYGNYDSKTFEGDLDYMLQTSDRRWDTFSAGRDALDWQLKFVLVGAGVLNIIFINLYIGILARGYDKGSARKEILLSRARLLYVLKCMAVPWMRCFLRFPLEGYVLSLAVVNEDTMDEDASETEQLMGIQEKIKALAMQMQAMDSTLKGSTSLNGANAYI